MPPTTKIKVINETSITSLEDAVNTFINNEDPDESKNVVDTVTSISHTYTSASYSVLIWYVPLC